MRASDVQFPHPALCLIEFPDEFDPGVFRDILDDIKRLHDASSRAGAILDMRNMRAGMVMSPARSECSRLTREMMGYLQDFGVCVARITTAPLIRAGLTIYDWTTPAPWERKTFGDVWVAESWVRSKLAAEGIELPAKHFFPRAPSRHSA